MWVKSLILFLFYAFQVNAQKLHIQGGLNLSRLSMDYSYMEGSGGIQYSLRDMFANTYIGYGASGGVEFFDANRTSFLLMLQYNNIGGKLGSDDYSLYVQSAQTLLDKFTINQLSLNPILKYKLIDQDKFNFHLLTGVKVDYNLSHSRLSNNEVRFLNINDKLQEQLNSLGLSLNLGFGIEYLLTDKIGVSSNLIYNQHVSKLSNKDVHTNPLGVLLSSSVNFFQFQTGVTYKLH